MALVENYLLGMDCGTTNIKAVILGEDGERVAEASRPNRFLSPGPGMQEQSAEQWWGEAVSIFRELARSAGREVTARIRAICISSHTVSLLPVDAEGRPLRNAMTYQDGRSSKELGAVVSRLGFDHYVQITGAQPAVAFLPGKLLWYKEHEPDLFARTDCFLQASSYINFRLTGVRSSDIDQATRTQCLNMKTLEWSDEMSAALGIDLNEYLPMPVLTDEIIGTVTRTAAEETGLCEGTPVLAGCSDAMAAMLATGMSQIGEAGESSGTSSLVFIGSRTKSALDIPVVTRPCPIDGMPWIFDAPISTTGAALRWYIQKFCEKEQADCEAAGKNIYTYLNETALDAPAGSNGLYFFPYLLGERAPIWSGHARGMFIGMGMEMTKADLTRSVFEGTAYALRHVIETVKESGGECSSLRVCGGGAKSRTWSMIKASMLQCPVKVLDEKSGDVPIGDALLAGHKAGVFPSLTDAVKKIVKVSEVIEPNPQWAETYDRLYPYYIRFYQDLDKDLKERYGRPL